MGKSNLTVVGTLYTEDCCPRSGPITYPIRRFSGTTLGNKIQTAINSIPSGSTIDCQGAFESGIPLQINQSINITKQVTILLGSYTIESLLDSSSNVFNIQTSGVRIIGNGSSTKSSNEHGPTRIVMNSGNLHIYAWKGTGATDQVASIVIKDLDLIGKISTYYAYNQNTTNLKSGSSIRTFNLNGSGGILISEPRPYQEAQGNNTSRTLLIMSTSVKQDITV